MTRQKLLVTLWKAVWTVTMFAIGAVPVYLIFSGSGRETAYPGNSSSEREKVDPAYALRQQEAQAEAAHIRERRRYWLEEIAHQNASFREAACEIECRGYWDEEDNVCRKQLHDDPKPLAPGKSHRVDQCV